MSAGIATSKSLSGQIHEGLAELRSSTLGEVSNDQNLSVEKLWH
jgi:hypothetical protein